jgi:hypothetical protein
MSPSEAGRDQTSHIIIDRHLLVSAFQRFSFSCQWSARSLGRNAHLGNMTFCWTDPFTVVSRPLALSRTGLLPSDVCISSALGPVGRPCPVSTIIHFSGFDYAACVLASPLLRTAPFSARSSVRLPTWWLAFGRVGLEYSSHPLGNVDMFQEVSPLFSRPEFSSARAAIGSASEIDRTRQSHSEIAASYDAQRDTLNGSGLPYGPCQCPMCRPNAKAEARRDNPNV